MCGIGSVVTLLTTRALIGFEPGPQCSCRENAVVPKFSAYVTSQAMVIQMKQYWVFVRVEVSEVSEVSDIDTLDTN